MGVQKLFIEMGNRSIPVDSSTFYGRCALAALAEGNLAEARQWAASAERTSKPGPVAQNGGGRIYSVTG